MLVLSAWRAHHMSTRVSFVCAGCALAFGVTQGLLRPPADFGESAALPLAPLIAAAMRFVPIKLCACRKRPRSTVPLCQAADGAKRPEEEDALAHSAR